MNLEKTEPPPYVARDSWTPQSWRRGVRRSRALRAAALACLAFIAFAQWKQLTSAPDGIRTAPEKKLSVQKLQEGWETCGKLRQKPKDPIGEGRERNARYVDGQKPTLIRNATVWVGEPAKGTSADEARAGKGYSWTTADVFLQYGLIMKVEPEIATTSLPEDTIIWDAEGRQLTSGIVDMHSHAGVDSLPTLRGNSDVNEMSADITPWARSIDGIQPSDYQLQVIKSGGVTTSLILPGSGNNIGGEAYVIKHAVGPHDGRPEISAADMLADPDRNWRYMKMACGENAKRVFGKVGERGPVSRLGESWEFRHAFEQAAKLVQEQDDWCDAAAAVGAENMGSYLPLDLKWESLGAVLRGQVHVNTHCYTVPDLEAFIDHTNEFKFPLRAFHHAHQTFAVPEMLKRVWGGDPPASCLFADNMWYKAEAYIGTEHAGKILWDNGLTPIYVSDNPVLNAQHVVFEAAKAYHYGLPYHVALASVTTAPAERLGLGQRIGKVKPGFDADVVVWDSDPLSVAATPLQVWIDGTAQFKDPVQLSKPLTAPLAPDSELEKTPGDPEQLQDVVFTGVSRVFLDGYDEAGAHGESLNVAISKGKITCVGTCTEELDSASMNCGKLVSLKNGYLTRSFTAFGSYLGLSEIDAEGTTANGPSPIFSRGVDGLALDTKKLHVAHAYGVTKAISAPQQGGDQTHHGTSVGFLTGAVNKLADNTVFADDAAVHFTLAKSSFSIVGELAEKTSISGVVGALRHSLLEAVAHNETITDPYSRIAYLKKVVAGEKPLVITVHSADAIAAALQVKKAVEDAIAAKTETAKPPTIRMAIIGGAESHLVAKELAAANVGVVLAPLRSYRVFWDQRRALTGAPLTNGTAVDVLLDAGVVTAIGLEEDWLVRDMALLAGIAYGNGGGRLSPRTALDLISTNVYKMLGLEESREMKEEHFIVYEGNPLEISSRIKAVGGGLGYLTVME